MQAVQRWLIAGDDGVGRPHRMGFTLSLTVRRAQIQIVTAIELNHLIDDAYAVYAA